MRLERDGNPLSCPVDRNNLIPDKDIFPDKATQRKILSLNIKCPSEGCQWTGELRSKDGHLASCPLKVVPCTNENCHVTLARKDLELHVTTKCQWRLLRCNHCSLLHPACKKEAHQNECKRFPLNCPEGCGVVVPREEIAAHIEKDCVLTIISCPYAAMGCSQKIKRGDVEHHLQTDMRLHLDLSCVKLNNTEEQLRNIQEELHHTQEKFETITRKLQEKVIALEKSLMQGSEEHTWKISGITQFVMSRQKKGAKESAPFYTRKYGYKFEIRLSYEPSLDIFDTVLVLYFSLMKGEYDAILPWPFNERVTFTLIDQQENQNDRKNIVAFLPANADNRLWNQKPVSDENERKCLDVVEFDELTKRRFIVDDTIFIQVKIDPP